MFCPGCNCHDPSDEHLFEEHRSLRKAGFNKMFGYNARRADNQIIAELRRRGYTHEPNLFGPIELKEWSY